MKFLEQVFFTIIGTAVVITGLTLSVIVPYILFKFVYTILTT